MPPTPDARLTGGRARPAIGREADEKYPVLIRQKESDLLTKLAKMLRAEERQPNPAPPAMASASALRLWAAQVTHVECFHRSAKAFKGEFACKFYVRQCLDGAEDINID